MSIPNLYYYEFENQLLISRSQINHIEDKNLLTSNKYQMISFNLVDDTKKFIKDFFTDNLKNNFKGIETIKVENWLFRDIFLLDFLEQNDLLKSPDIAKKIFYTTPSVNGGYQEFQQEKGFIGKSKELTDIMNQCYLYNLYKEVTKDGYMDKKLQERLCDEIIQFQLFIEEDKKRLTKITDINMELVSSKEHKIFIKIMKDLSHSLYIKSMFMEYVHKEIYQNITLENQKPYDKFFKELLKKKDDFLVEYPSFSICIDKIQLSSDLSHKVRKEKITDYLRYFASFMNKRKEEYGMHKVMLSQGIKEDNFSFVFTTEENMLKNKNHLKKFFKEFMLSLHETVDFEKFLEKKHDEFKVLKDLELDKTVKSLRVKL